MKIVSFGKYYFLFILLLGLSACFTTPQFVDASNFKLKGYKPQENTLKFSIDLTILNPNGYGIKVRKSKMDIYVGDFHIGQGQLEEAFKMRRKNETICHVPLKLTLERRAIFKLLGLTTKKNAKIRLVGTLRASVFGIPKREKIDQERNFNLSDLNINLKGFL